MTRGQQRPARHGLGDPRIAWIVLLDVATAQPPLRGHVAAELESLAREAGWPRPSEAAVVDGDRRPLLATLASGGGADAVRVGLHSGGLVVAARHDLLDGLAMLGVAGRLLGAPVRSSARGVGDRPVAASALVRRAWEVAVHPPARVADSRTSGRAGDVFAETVVTGSPRTADLVHAASQAIVRWNGRRGGPTQRISVAVGVSTVSAADHDLADRSAFLRLSGVERLTADEIGERLAHAPLQPGAGRGAGAGGALLGVASRAALRLAAPRLGSTVLVSHLGALEAPSSVERASFHPVSGGGSGLALGAATLHGSTTLTLRGRAGQHDDEGLHQVLTLVVDALS